jgi:hypothetical protein
MILYKKNTLEPCTVSLLQMTSTTSFSSVESTPGEIHQFENLFCFFKQTNSKSTRKGTLQDSSSSSSSSSSSLLRSQLNRHHRPHFCHMNLSPVFTSALIAQHHVSSNLDLDDLALKKEQGGGGEEKEKEKMHQHFSR